MTTPRRRRPSRGENDLSAGATRVLSGTLDVLCEHETLTASEIGDHTDLVAEVADALAALTDRLARDLAADPESEPGVTTSLRGVRDRLAGASSHARRCAGELYRARFGPR